MKAITFAASTTSPIEFALEGVQMLRCTLFMNLIGGVSRRHIVDNCESIGSDVSYSSCSVEQYMHR
ncbi:hypothetical protein A2U01_0094837, partial [Trifolium medium]|nr:hypothetical protein [Trifolium medium]